MYHNIIIWCTQGSQLAQLFMNGLVNRSTNLMIGLTGKRWQYERSYNRPSAGWEEEDAWIKVAALIIALQTLRANTRGRLCVQQDLYAPNTITINRVCCGGRVCIGTMVHNMRHWYYTTALLHNIVIYCDMGCWACIQKTITLFYLLSFFKRTVRP